LESGDVIHVDTGHYVLNSNIVLDLEVSGIRIVGSGLGETIIDRNNDTSNAYAFELTGADSVTVDSLTITGARIGVYAGSSADSDGLTIRNSRLDSNRNEEVLVDSSNDDFTLVDSMLVDSGPFSASGLLVNGNNVTVLNSQFQGHFDAVYLRGRGNQVSGSTIHGASNYGIRFSVSSDTGSAFTNNQVFDNERGMVVSTTQGVQTLVQGNQVFQNLQQGLEAIGNVLLDGNMAYDNGAGLLVRGVSATDNVIYGNQEGISVTGIDTILDGNRVFANTGYGIRAFGDSRLTDNQVYSNQIGIGLTQGNAAPAVVTNNLVYDNVAIGILVDEPNSRIWNNTIVQPTGVGLLLDDGADQVRFENNILQAGGDRAIEVTSFSASLLESNHNLIHLPDNSLLARVGNADLPDGSRWYQEFGQDQHSRIGSDSNFDPQFIDPDGIDEGRGFVTGIDYGADDDFRLAPQSPGIDAADPRIDFTEEPSPNGTRANIGAFGDPPNATNSQDSSITIVSPEPFSRFEAGAPLPVHWIASGNAVIAPGDAQYEQTVLNATPRGYWRLDNTDGSAQDISGSGNHGTVQGNVVFDQPGAFGNNANTAMSFDATGGSVSIPNSGTLSAPIFSVGAWVYANDDLADFNTILSKSSSFTWNNGFGLYYHSGQVRFFVDNDNLVENPAGTLKPHKWTHVLGTFDGDSASLYVDGVLVGTQSGLSGILSSAPLTLGYGGTTGRHWPGTIDEVTYFDRVLDDSEIDALANRNALSSVDVSLVDIAQGTSQTLASSLSARGTFEWMIPTDLAPGTDYRIQVTSQDPQSAFATSPLFQIVNPGNHYYINDDSLTDDEYTTAVGSDDNDGKTPESPMRSIQSLLQSYELGAGDVIYVDTGNYQLLSNIRLEQVHSGLTIRGPEQLGNEAILDRGNTVAGAYAIELAGADNTAISNLSLTGGYHGLYAAAGADSDGNRLDGIRSFDNLRTEIWLQDSNDQNTIEDGEFFDSVATIWHGIHIDSDGNLLLGNQVRDQQYGIFNSSGNDNQFLENELIDNDRGIYAIIANGHAIEINGNEALGGEYGIYVQGSFNTSTSTRVIGNITRNNSIDGILSQGEVDVDFNTSFDNARFGINVRNRGTATGNTTYRNWTGLRIGDSQLFADAFSNRSFGNSNFGIEAFEGSTVDGNVSYSNSVGIVGTGIVGFSGSLTNNLSYANTNAAMLVHKGRSGAIAVNNTAYQAVGEAFRVQGGTQNLVLRNNLLGIESGAAILVETSSTTGFNSDHNLFDLVLPQTANVGNWGGTEVATLADWQQASGSDLSSGLGDPNFVDVDGADNVFGYDPLADGGNGYDGGPDDNFL
ncbi:MAG: right-handed parallel beta-helix repeat-containing protein, partial [Planctomycetota bacterium]